MRICALILIALVCFTSCGSSKKTTHRESNPSTHNSDDSPANTIVNTALKFDGVKYKYGGTSKKGMDCSGLVVTAFKSEDIVLPRTTSQLKSSGHWVDLKEVKKGDLLFFATKKNSRKVNHVGIVTSTKKNEVKFIHASTSKGVITSLLSERYWYFAFVQARRIL